MKTFFGKLILLILLNVTPLVAQERSRTTPVPSRSGQPKPAGPGSYASDIIVVSDAQQQALEQARQMLEESQNSNERAALETAIKEMERAQAALEQAKNSREKLPAALAAQQSAYQALLKTIPREHRISQSKSRSQGKGQGQQNQRQLDQLEMKAEENRYETERQAKAAPSAEQREKLETTDRLKELAQRQQDLNDRLRELQAALQAARTEKEREEAQRQLKRLQDEQRQALADVDELRQKLEQSPNTAEARKQLEQTRSDMERAAQELEKKSPSQALAAGTRAQQKMEELREDLRKETSSQFSEQMRELRNDARELSQQQEKIARDLDALENGKQKSLDTAAKGDQLGEQMARQKSALTNLLSEMRTVTEQAESTEPLLSRQLYETLRRTEQAHTDNLLDMGEQLTRRGFFPQANEAERAARTNITELRQSVERAAESVLGNEADALRYAQKELNDLVKQLESETGAARTNSSAGAVGGKDAKESGTNRLSAASGQAEPENNSKETADPKQLTQNNSPEGEGGKSSEETKRAKKGGEGKQASDQNSNKGKGTASSKENSEKNNEENSKEQQSAQSNSSSEPNDSSKPGEAQDGQAGGGKTGKDSLRELVEQLGREGKDGGNGGPITGNNFMNWSDRLRDVEQVLEPDLRNQLATVRERVSALRQEFRERGQKPDAGMLQNQILAPMTQVRVWLQQELSRQQNDKSLVPLDRDPVPENYSDLVRKYYEKLGSAQ